MQRGVLLERAPETAAQPVRVADVERSGNRSAIAFRDNENEMPGKGLADAVEELQVQVRRRAVLAVGLAVAAIEERPVALADFVALQPLELDAGVAHLAALLPHFLALVVAEAGEKFIEAAVAAVGPVKLHGRPPHHPVRDHALCLLPGGKQAVQGGNPQLARKFQRRRDETVPNRVRFGQQARSGDGSERDCR